MATGQKNRTRRKRRGADPAARRTRRAARPRRALAFYLRHLILWVLVVFGGYWMWLDRDVTRAFENKRWALPARVFARPLELYPGAAIARRRLARELERLGYQRTAGTPSRGQFAVSSDRLEFGSRGYGFWDFPEPERRVSLAFDGDSIRSITDTVTSSLVDLMRLEPPEIGRINPRRYEDRKLLGYEEIPRDFVAALVAVEDRRYFSHFGVDLIGFARAMVANLRALRFIQGGSTLTQQLVKNLYLTRDRTVARKFNEMLMAISLDRRYSKEEILETYVNEVFLGQDGNRAIHGFELAARFYFAKPLAELDMAESATLIGMIKGPSVYDPRRNPEASLRRRNVVLSVLERQGLLAPRLVEGLRRRRLEIHTGEGGRDTDFPAFMGLVKRQLLRDYRPDDLNAAGLNVFTTIDVELQQTAEKGVRETVAEIERAKRQQGLQAAVVIADARSGEILTMIGDRNPTYAGFNRALDARRPVGSVIKPFVYAKALEEPRRYSLATKLDDLPVTWEDGQGKVWQPRNFDGREHGEVSMLDALIRSLNLATVDLGMRLGVEQVADYLEHLGIGGELPPYPSIFLGAVDMSPFQLAELYTIIANDGFRVPLRAISAVTDQSQRKLTRYGLELKPVMRPATAAIMRYALSRVVAEGTARDLMRQLGGIQPLAGKTGTSNDHRDSWFAGFGANRLGVTWVGRDDNEPTGLTGSSGALRIWAAVMRGAGLRPLELVLTHDVTWQRVNLSAGTIIEAGCSGGELIPVHLASVIPRAPDCAGHLPQSKAPRGVFERIREFFR
jgi:penicillin-binding protein 1B